MKQSSRADNKIKQTKRTPIILVPGDGGSQIEAKLDKPEVVHYFCDRKTDAFFNLWLNLALLVPFVIDCWTDNMRLVYDNSTRRTSNPPGVMTRIPHWGNTTAIEFIDPTQVAGTAYFSVLVNELVREGYTRGVDLRGAPYDFRKAPQELEDFFVKFEALVKETYQMNGREKMILVCHSMGCQMMLYFLNRRSQSWKDKYISSLVTLACPWGGAVKALKAFASGDNLGVIVVKALTIRKDERTFPSLSFLLPTDKFWAHNETIITTGKMNYTVANFDQFFKDINYTTGYNMWLDVRNLTYDLKHPRVELHCLHGDGISTMEYLEYKNSTFPNQQPKITYGDGDGTVNIRSLRGCLKWNSTHPAKPFYYANFTNVEHMSIMGSPPIVNYIKKLAIRNVTYGRG
ncbi:group XV phospholipase A2-like protein [Leptotrombidium deliense]|uniref:Group XV phospholipase A2-like protein n=1 Tax=Leptotrombidium deliense TaxID=299467 RepID=A0A443SMC6_9ACAR|nr:group XV phospholipase A2-like protein [Leptotrombidium deliense]